MRHVYIDGDGRMRRARDRLITHLRITADHNTLKF